MKAILTRLRAPAALAACLVAFAAAGPPARAQGPAGTAAAASPYAVESLLDWERLALTLRIRLDLMAAGLRLPAGRLEAERMIDRDLPNLAKEAIFALAVDSRRDVADTVADGSLDVNDLLALSKSARRVEASLSRDMRSFEAVFEFSVLDISSLYIRHSAAIPLEEPLAWAPSRPYTGLVIYAKGELPVHGEKVRDRLKPCLFARIYDEDMNPILDRNVVDPSALRAGGELAYTSAPSGAVGSRAGDDPARIIAIGLFGENRTDIVISREDARRFLSRPENREALRQGRVLVVFDPSH
jgi:hypothetical protein